MWSFGVCLWEILSLASVRPHARMDDRQVLDLLATMSSSSQEDQVVLERPSNCPRDVYDLMMECWRREPQARPSFREIHLFLQRKNIGYAAQQDPLVQQLLTQ